MSISDNTKRRMMSALWFLPDKAYISFVYRIKMGKPMNWGNPQTFNEKLQWLKIHDRKHIYTTMVDKAEAKKYVADIIGEEHIIPTIGVWDRFEDIDFNNLPNQFVLKCTHDSGGLVICKDKTKLDIEAVRKKMNISLKTNYFLYGREWPYKDVKPRILAEQYMQNGTTHELRDYKVFCFEGTAKCYKVDFDRFVEHHANYYDPHSNILSIGETDYPPDIDRMIEPPKCLPEIIFLAEKLSKEHPFLRSDFYDVDGKVYFGELTFYPASGFGKLLSDGDDLLGSWIKLPKSIKKKGGAVIKDHD